jgi:hypothetical protein
MGHDEVFRGPARHREAQARQANIQSDLSEYKNILCPIIPPCQVHSETASPKSSIAEVPGTRPACSFQIQVPPVELPDAMKGMVIQAFYDRITGIYVKLLCVLERVSLAPVLSFPIGLLSLSLAMTY